MSLELLLPVDEENLKWQSILPKQILGKNILIHTKNSGLPDLNGLQIVIIGLSETRNRFFENKDYNKNNFRKVFYDLYPGYWSLKIADLGNLPNGAKIEDTYFAI